MTKKEKRVRRKKIKRELGPDFDHRFDENSFQHILDGSKDLHESSAM